ncbi:hypothetical protein IV203_013916 [Nitzschia inconspicua]|uniref:Uncharacterized protein n=1 Tax=Nitzschia inconspicua TaxID=303405 RepID=A0A9K3M9D5_9STRA|nr:hypothetical protein IV203_013916 [Nitzschia inconspicua]
MSPPDNKRQKLDASTDHDGDEKAEDGDDQGRSNNSGAVDSENETSRSILPDLTQTNDLMKRLQSFIPKIQAANRELNVEGDLTMQLDVNLEKECDDSSDSDSRSSSSSSSSDDSNPGIQEISSNGLKTNASVDAAALGDSPGRSSPVGPTIQLQFAVGDMTNNPMMELLQSTEEDDDRESESEASANKEVSSERFETISRLLHDKKLSSENGDKKIVSLPLEGGTKNKPERPLITEL